LVTLEKGGHLVMGHHQEIARQVRDFLSKGNEY
jgi:hypothetical protein